MPSPTPTPDPLDITRFAWIASHLVKWELGLTTVSVTWLDDEGVPQNKHMVLPDELCAHDLDMAHDVIIFRYVIDKISAP
jgi:hypothetical protein